MPDGSLSMLQTRGPALIMLAAGVIGALGSLTGDIALHESPFNWVAAALAVLAAFIGWEFYRKYRDHAPQRVRSVLIAVGAVVIGALMLLGGGSVGLLWSLLLAALGLNLMFSPLE
jgi:hypothetical protein